MSEDQVLERFGWIFRTRLPEGEGPHPVMLMLHGWTGDENVTSIFTTRLSRRYVVLAPRGSHPAPTGGYGWHAHREGTWPPVDEFRPAVSALLDWLSVLDQHRDPGSPWEFADFTQVDMTGFSQGAALAYTFSLLHPQRVRRVAGLAGFLPADAEALAAGRPLNGKKIFAANGTRDERVPIELAKHSIQMLEDAGAEVTFCVEDVGHKLSLNCFKSYAEFFKLAPAPQEPPGSLPE